MKHKRSLILLVDDNLTNLTVGKTALMEQHDVLTVSSADKMFKLLKRTVPDLILLDVEMPEMDGYEAIRHLKADPATADIPVVFLTGKTDSGSELEGLSLGAIDYVVKPFSPPLLRKRIEVHLLVETQRKELKNYNDNLQRMVAEKTDMVLELQGAILKTMAGLVEWRDDITGEHIERTGQCLELLVDALLKRGIYLEEMGDWDIPLFLQSSQLHDVGKIAIRDSILLKPGKLTDEEFEEMKAHTAFGVKVIEKIQGFSHENDFLTHAKLFAGAHHEKWDGSGYPAGLSGEDIPLHGRLMAIVDVYDALVSERPYKPAYAHTAALEAIEEGRGAHFDPLVAEVFMEIAPQIAQIYT